MLLSGAFSSYDFCYFAQEGVKGRAAHHSHGWLAIQLNIWQVTPCSSCPKGPGIKPLADCGCHFHASQRMCPARVSRESVPQELSSHKSVSKRCPQEYHAVWWIWILCAINERKMIFRWRQKGSSFSFMRPQPCSEQRLATKTNFLLTLAQERHSWVTTFFSSRKSGTQETHRFGVNDN